MKTLLYILFSGLFSFQLFGQDSLKVYKSSPYRLNRQSVVAEPVEAEPYLRPASFDDGAKKARRDISGGIVVKKLLFRSWCSEEWKPTFEQFFTDKFQVKIKWIRVSTKPHPMYSLHHPGRSTAAFYNGYYSIMDSAVNQKIAPVKLDSLVQDYKTKYGVNEETCPSEMYRFGVYMTPPKAIIGKKELEKTLNQRVKESGSEYSGKMVLSIAVNREGKVTYPKVIRGVGPKVNDLAKNLLLDTEFTPCIKKDKPINCTFTYVLEIQNPKN